VRKRRYLALRVSLAVNATFESGLAGPMGFQTALHWEEARRFAARTGDSAFFYPKW
jgi:hypothetical protein